MSKKILAVDDSKTMRDMVAFTLKNAGFEVVQAHDGEDAVRMLDIHGEVDLVITDLNMPNMDGFALVDHLRGSMKHKNVPILMLTTESDAEKKQRGRSGGATGWIVKPFNPDKLIEAVNKVCA